MMKYKPYKSDKPDKKYYIITNDNEKVYFGAAGISDFTIHKDEARKQRYIDRHKKNESKYWRFNFVSDSIFLMLNTPQSLHSPFFQYHNRQKMIYKSYY